MSNQNFFVVIDENTPDQITLHTVYVSEFLLAILDSVFGYSIAVIEAQTNVFQVDLSGLTPSSPVLPWTFDDAFFWTQGIVGEHALGHWELAFWDFVPRTFEPLGFLDTPPPIVSASWTYRPFVKRKPDNTDVLPYNEVLLSVDGFGITMSNPSASGSGSGFRLFQSIIGPTAPGVDNSVITDEAIWLHEMGQGDLSEFSFSWDSVAAGRYSIQASAAMPNGVVYSGDGVLNISSEFSAEIDTYYAVIGNYTYYFLDLKDDNAITMPTRSTRNTNYPFKGGDVVASFAAAIALSESFGFLDLTKVKEQIC